jgi:GntR family transcriptional repressor for pyruvate dehydrogenase complex
MSFELRTVDRSKLYSGIVDQLVDGIRSGGFPPGSALPSERILATQLGVSRSSVREAIRVLEHAGVLDVRTGSGTFVSEAGLSNASMLRARAAVLGDHSPLDVVVARVALEPLGAEGAATHRRSRDLEFLRSTVDQQEVLIHQGADPADVDMDFHLGIASASNNPVLHLLVERLVAIMRQATWRELKYRSNQRGGTFELFLAQHKAILEAIEAREPERAAAEMLQHLKSIEVGLLSEVSGAGEASAASDGAGA